MIPLFLIGFTEDTSLWKKFFSVRSKHYKVLTENKIKDNIEEKEEHGMTIIDIYGVRESCNF